MRTTLSIPPPAAPALRSDALETAAGIAERLVREAVWYRGRCNWMAFDADAEQPVHRAMGPGLGTGSAGVALFLAQLAAFTSDDMVRRTALGAIGQALGHADQAATHGLYSGRIGIAYAAARCGVLLGDERVIARAARLARGRWGPADRFDLVTGSAGTIAGLLALASVLGDERLADRAQRLADDLIGAARRGHPGWSWPPAPDGRRMHGLCGMASGTSGIGWALLELHAVTRDERHRAAADRALAYERHWFDPEQVEWPDLRGIERREPRGTFRAPAATGWCDGAAGIALARVRAHELTGDERRRAEATTALARTIADVERELLPRGADFTLARGIAGSAEALLLGAELLRAGEAPARRAGEIAASRYAGSLDGWPCGPANAGLAPGLLHGHAGIGLFYLRLHDRCVPSPLLIGAPA
jgi:lantibiotic modifying enzyme